MGSQYFYSQTLWSGVCGGCESRGDGQCQGTDAGGLSLVVSRSFVVLVGFVRDRHFMPPLKLALP